MPKKMYRVSGHIHRIIEFDGLVCADSKAEAVSIATTDEDEGYYPLEDGGHLSIIENVKRNVVAEFDPFESDESAVDD